MVNSGPTSPFRYIDNKNNLNSYVDKYMKYEYTGNYMIPSSSFTLLLKTIENDAIISIFIKIIKKKYSQCSSLYYTKN